MSNNYTHLFQSRWVTPRACQHTKLLGDGARAATWTVSGTHIGLAFDQTNEIDGGYRLVSPGTTDTAPLYLREMPVGEAFRRDVAVEILNVKTGARRAVTWRGWVDSVWDGPALGNVPAGRYALVGWTFDIVGDGEDGDPRGSVEFTLCHLDYGPVAWRETMRRNGAVRTWYGVRDVPRATDPLAQFVEAIPTDVTPEPDPEPDPMPIPEPTITDPEAANAGGRIEHFYTKYADRVGYTAREVHTDPLSYVWAIRYYQARQRGTPHEPAIQAVERSMAASVGVLEPEPTPDPDPVEPGSRPAGPLRRRGRVLADDRGDRLLLSASMFHATTLLQHEPALFADNLAASAEARIDEWRIGGVINWPADIQDERPTEPGHVETLVGTIDRIWDAGLRTDLCLFLAQIDVPELRSLSACEDYTRTVCRALRDRAHMVRVTIANEPGDGHRIWGHGLAGLRRMRDIVRAELPGVLVSLGAPFHPTALATTDWTAGSVEGAENAFAWFETGCDIVSPHYSRASSARRNTRQPWLGRRDSTLDSVLNDEEPIGSHNYYDASGNLTGLNEQRGDVIGMQRTAAWVCGHAITTFHSGAGIGYQRVHGPHAYLRLRDMPGLFACAAGKDILPGHLPAYRVANWHWSLDQGQLFERSYEPSDTDGTPATRGHCATRLDAFVDHEFFAEQPYELRARARVEFAVWERQGTRYVQVDERALGINDRIRLEPCLDRVLVGTLR